MQVLGAEMSPASETLQKSYASMVKPEIAQIRPDQIVDVIVKMDKELAFRASDFYVQPKPGQMITACRFPDEKDTETTAYGWKSVGDRTIHILQRPMQFIFRARKDALSNPEKVEVRDEDRQPLFDILADRNFNLTTNTIDPFINVEYVLRAGQICGCLLYPQEGSNLEITTDTDFPVGTGVRGKEHPTFTELVCFKNGAINMRYIVLHQNPEDRRRQQPYALIEVSEEPNSPEDSTIDDALLSYTDPKPPVITAKPVVEEAAFLTFKKPKLDE